MGLLSQLEKRGCSQTGVRSEDSVSVQPPEKTAADEKPADRIAASAAPCSACGSVLAWLDIYGGGPHCHRCRPWPSETFIRSLIGYDAQAGGWRTIWPPDASQDQSTGERDSCEHPVTRKRVVWPIAADRSCIKIDFDRVAEVEVFLECVTCGEWIRESER